MSARIPEHEPDVGMTDLCVAGLCVTTFRSGTAGTTALDDVGLVNGLVIVTS